MASDYLLELDGVKGESDVVGYEGLIELESFSFGVSNPGSFAHGGGGGAGKASFQDMHFTARTTSASPLLKAHCATGKHLASATLHVRKSGGKQEIYFMKVEMKEILVSSYGVIGTLDLGPDGPAGVVMDAVSLNFKINNVFEAQADPGTPGTP